MYSALNIADSHRLCRHFTTANCLIIITCILAKYSHQFARKRSSPSTHIAHYLHPRISKTDGQMVKNVTKTHFNGVLSDLLHFCLQWRSQLGLDTPSRMKENSPYFKTTKKLLVYRILNLSLLIQTVSESLSSLFGIKWNKTIPPSK